MNWSKWNQWPLLSAILAAGLCCSSNSSSTDSSSNTDSSSTDASTNDTDSGDSDISTHFSFFVTSLKAMQELSGNKNGFGGDLRYQIADADKDKVGAGLKGADFSAVADIARPFSHAIPIFDLHTI